MIFTLMTSLLAIVASIVIVLPLLTNKQTPVDKVRSDTNIAAATSQLAELKDELNQGQISQQQFDRYRLDIETAAMADIASTENKQIISGNSNRILAASIILIVLLISWLLYQQNGFSTYLAAYQQQLADAATKQAEINQLITKVESYRQAHPKDSQSRLILAQVYLEQQRFGDAAAVYQELTELTPDDPDILVDYADALARAHGNRLMGKPTELLQQALHYAPNHQRALWLVGFAEQQAGNNEQAVKYWQQLLNDLEAETAMYHNVTALIAEVNATASTTSTDASNTLQANNSKDMTSIEVTATIAPAIKDKLNLAHTLFVFARSADGPAMPLAVYRGIASSLPITITLDDTMTMLPKRTLSQFPKVIIGARLSSNGQPQGQAGDLEGFSNKINVLETGSLELVIDSIKP